MSVSKSDLYSRQIGAIGLESMIKLQKLDVLLIGANATGLECAKCLALQGIRSIHVYDNNSTNKLNTIDLYYNKKTESNKLSENCINLVRELNSNVDANIINNLSYEYIIKSNIQVVILTKLLKDVSLGILKMEKFCIDNNIRFILGISGGLEGYVFSNFGNHTIIDKDAESCESGYVENYNINDNIITINIEKLKKNINSNTVILDNNSKILELQVLSSNLTSINVKYRKDIELFLKNNNSIRCIEKKDVIYKKYKSISEIVKKNNYTYISANNIFTSGKSDILYKRFTDLILCKKNNSSIEEHNLEEVLFTYPSKSLFILSSMIGGIIAHEVIKTTGKYTPLDTDLYIDFTALQGRNLYKSNNYRNANYLDKNLIKRLKKLNIFMVGCGALGCEISKNLGMIECCTGCKGTLTITDMDKIELSNLSRQFLFREDSIGKFKSDVIAERLVDYMPNLKINNLNLELAKETEKVFNSTFWSNKDIIINALDNIEARKYVDQKCIEFKKPLFESGTLGAKCNTQNIIPHKTATYSEIIDTDDINIPMCTIKSFPNKIEHCVEWSLEIFNEIFGEGIEDLNKFLRNKKDFKEEIDKISNEYLIYNRLNLLKQLILIHEDKSTFKIFDYIRFIYDNYFKNPVIDLLNTFKPDMIDSNGIKYWSGKKLKPKILSFSDIEINFVKNIYSLLSNLFNIDSWSYDKFTDYLENSCCEDYTPKKIDIDESNDRVSIEVDYNELKYEVFNNIKTNKKTSYIPIKYDKDNKQLLEVMTVLSNTRAKIYTIPTVSRIDIQLISGKIIPALSTTTTVIAAMVIIDLLKYLTDLKPIDCNINLGTNQYILFESYKPEKIYNNMFSKIYGMPIKTVPYEFTNWDKIKILSNTDMCPDIKSIISLLKDDYNIVVSKLLYNTNIIYKSNSDNNILLYELYKKFNKQLCENFIIDIISYDNSGIPVLTPQLLISNK